MLRKWLVLLPLIAVCLLPPAAKAAEAVEAAKTEDWNTYRHDQGRSGYTSESIATPLAVNWKFSTISVSGNPSSPAVTGNLVVFTAGNLLFVLDPVTGAEKWNSGQAIEGTIKTSPTVVDGTIYVGSSSGNLYCFAPQSPTEWRFRWAFRTDGPVRSSPVVDGNTVYFGSDDNCFYAVDAKEGKQIWRKRFASDITAAPALADGRIIFTTGDLMTYAIDTGTEKPIIRWQYRTRLSSSHTSPVVEGDRAYIAAGNQIFCLSARTGRERWSHTLVPDISSTPAVHDGVAYFCTRDSRLWAIGDKGKLQWKAKLDFPSYSPPTIAGDTLFVGTNKGDICAFDLKEAGEKIQTALDQRKFKAPELQPVWKYRVKPAVDATMMPDIVSAPVVSGQALYVLPDDGTLHCFTANAPDVDPPSVSYQMPTPNSTINGTPPVLIMAVLQDEGSGVNAATISLLLDKDKPDSGEPGAVGGPNELEHDYDPLKGILYYRTPVTQPARPLLDGRHTVTLQAMDYKGNMLTSSWDFTVNNKGPVNPVPQQNQPGMPGGQMGMPMP